MPGILCSVYDPSGHAIEPKWRHGLELVQHHPEHRLEQYSEPGFELACLYHPEVCQGPRILVTGRHVLACYGNIYEDELLPVPDGEALCRALLERFLKRGADGLKHLNGRYDIAVWDRHERVLHFISDRFGANRHYVLQRPGALHVACEVKALAVFLDHIEIDPAGLASMLSFGYHLGDLTLLKDVKCLPNARHLAYSAAADRLSLGRYWNYPYGEQEPWPESEAELAEALHGHLARALKRRLNGVKKILLPISGGLDSRTMAGLLAQSGFGGEVLAYSYGQPSSRDVRYGRAIARKLGYRHVTIPTPKDFMTRHLEQAAWWFDAEWSAELNWGARYAHTHPALGDTRGYCVLSGMFADHLLGADRFDYRRKSGEAPLASQRLGEIFCTCNQEYGGEAAALRLLGPDAADDARKSLDGIIEATFSPIARQVPFYAMMRAEFEHRQRRHTATVSQSLDYDFRVITPFLDREFVDFTLRIPFPLFHGKLLYKRMIRDYLPEVAAIPYAETGLPLTQAPFRAAIKWRMDALIQQFPSIQRLAARRKAYFSFHQGVMNQKPFFLHQAVLLDTLSPPLDVEKARERYLSLLDGRSNPVDQVCAFLPPALFLRELKSRLSESADMAAHAS
ncbi:MAG: hypothetical protein C3F18_09565 [Nitrosomonadales bacterium]|nr:MAG: hypothetical protein C3F18_09565 [Nitrosomonadales bacterium]